MRLNDLLTDNINEILLEAEKNHKTSMDTYKQINALKKFGFDANKSLWDNNKIEDKYKERIASLILQHTKNLNREIYQWLSKNYKFKAIYWKESNSSISQYTYFVLLNKTRCGIRISDHSKPKKLDVKTHLLTIFYNTFFNDTIKTKIDLFIKKYDENNLQNVA